MDMSIFVISAMCRCQIQRGPSGSTQTNNAGIGSITVYRWTALETRAATSAVTQEGCRLLRPRTRFPYRPFRSPIFCAKGTFLMTEQFAFQKIQRNGRTIKLYQSTPAALTGVVNGVNNVGSLTSLLHFEQSNFRLTLVNDA